MPLTSMYIHIPFCIHRCGYCDFITYAGLQRLIPAYSRAVSHEVKYLSQSALDPITIHTIYFGGGTPSLLSALELGEILATIKDYFTLVDSPEITLEANPGTLSAEYLNKLHNLGVNRISLGMQSANQDELTLLERQHTFDDVIRAVDWSRNAGINDLNLDLIFGLPSQTLQSWMTSLEIALSLRPDHLSLYALTLDPGTPLKQKVDVGILTLPDQDLVADIYEAATERLSKAGFIQYEISNWAREEKKGQLHACVHNLQYWRNLPYLGVGAGAHGFIDHSRTVNVANPQVYITRLSSGSSLLEKKYRFPKTPATVQVNPIDLETEMSETMMMGLRLVQEGVSAQKFHQRFGTSILERFTLQIDRLVYFGLLEWTGEQAQTLRLTSRGRFISNQVFMEFV
jgi:oxygen-independent coproporphyrinogen-3 oxidase